MSREMTHWTQHLILSSTARSSAIAPPLDVVPALTRLRRDPTPIPTRLALFTSHLGLKPVNSARIHLAGSAARTTRAPLLTWMAAAIDEPAGFFRLGLWPRGIPDGRYLGVLSSRLQRDLTEHRNWFAALRELDEQLAADAVLVTAQTTTAFPFLHRLTARRSRRLVAIYPSPANLVSASRWWRYASSLSLPHQDPIFPVLLSPLLPLPFPATTVSDDVRARSGAMPRVADIPVHRPRLSRPTAITPPLADRQIAQLADQLLVLRLRKAGRLAAWIRGLSTQTAIGPKPVWIAAGPGLVTPSLASELVQQGAHWWRSFVARKRLPLEILAKGLQHEFELDVELPDPLHQARRWPVAGSDP